MASSSATRWRLGCDACGAGGRVGPSASGFDAWCERCQTPARLPAAPGPGDRCGRCGAALPAEPRFVELWGMLQHLDAVLGAWAGEPGALAAILPERPRLLSDLTPPDAAPDDPPARAAALRALAHGDWRGTLAAPADADPRALAARAIAAERAGDVALANGAWGAALAAREDARARLARGALLARAGRFDEALADLALAGNGHEARWDRAAVAIMRAVAGSRGLPGAEVLARARAEAGAASAYWSDATVGRLLWTLLVERALGTATGVGRPGAGSPPAAARATLDGASRAELRAAELELEHATFWDRALVLLGWARLGEREEAGRVARPLAHELADSLLAEPSLAGEPLAGLARAVTASRSAVEEADPFGARRALAAALARGDLRRFRIPCAACARGTVGVEGVEEAGEVG